MTNLTTLVVGIKNNIRWNKLFRVIFGFILVFPFFCIFCCKVTQPYYSTAECVQAGLLFSLLGEVAYIILAWCVWDKRVAVTHKSNKK